MKFLSFVIPCYCSQQTIEDVISEIHNKMSERKDYSYEIIAVNDASPDNVYNVLKSLCQNDDRLKAVNLAKNSGKPSAQMAGYALAKGDIIVDLDDDGQCPIDRLWDLIEPLYNGYDVVYARYPDRKQSAFKNFGSKVNALMARYIIGQPKDLYISNFSAHKRFVSQEMIKYTNPYPYCTGLILRTTSKIRNVDMVERERAAGVGHFTFKKSLKLWLNGLTAFSVKPLRISTILGAICALIGFIFGITTIINKFIHPNVLIGYSSTMAVMLFIGGMIMLMLGMIGEYIGRIYICINNSPQYVIRETINVEHQHNEENYHEKS